jgi:hypothetical protein
LLEWNSLKVSEDMLNFFSQEQTQRGALLPLFSALVGIYEVMPMHKASSFLTLVLYEHKP